MGQELERVTEGSILPSTQSAIRSGYKGLVKQTDKALARLEANTVVRMAKAQSQALVAQQQVHELDRVAQTAMTGQALLNQWAVSLAAGDPLTLDEVNYFAGLARTAKGALLMALAEGYTREQLAHS